MRLRGIRVWRRLRPVLALSHGKKKPSAKDVSEKGLGEKGLGESFARRIHPLEEKEASVRELRLKEPVEREKSEDGPEVREPVSAGPIRGVSAHLGALEVSDVGTPSRRGNVLSIPITVKDGGSGASKQLHLQINLTERELPPVKVELPGFIYGWLLLVTAMAGAALAMVLR